MANYVEINTLNSPYTLDLASIKGLGGVVSDQIFVKSVDSKCALILGALSGVVGLPRITVVAIDNTLDIYTTGTDKAFGQAFSCNQDIASGLVVTLPKNCPIDITKFVSPSQNYWKIG